jgi:hypothetical protein
MLHHIHPEYGNCYVCQNTKPSSTDAAYYQKPKLYSWDHLTPKENLEVA